MRSVTYRRLLYALLTIGLLASLFVAVRRERHEHRANRVEIVMDDADFQSLARSYAYDQRAFLIALRRAGLTSLAVQEELGGQVSSSPNGALYPGPALLEGARATLRELHRAFEKAGIKIIDPAGQPFDPAWHEAMVAQESREHPPNTVLSAIQKGYSLNGRLLRPARVIVSKAPGGDGN